MVSVLTVRPCGLPEIADGRLRFDQLPGEIDQLTAQVPKDVAEPGGVPSRMWQTLDQPHGDKGRQRSETQSGWSRSGASPLPMRSSRTGSTRPPRAATPRSPLDQDHYWSRRHRGQCPDSRSGQLDASLVGTPRQATSRKDWTVNQVAGIQAEPDPYLAALATPAATPPPRR
jgi:hypothetical protein